MDDMRKVVSFASVEEFWGLYNNIVPPSQLPGKANYYLFKDGIMPAWEDAQNKDGGKWSIQFPREKSKSVVDKMWLYTVSLDRASSTGRVSKTSPRRKTLKRYAETCRCSRLSGRHLRPLLLLQERRAHHPPTVTWSLA